MHAFSTSKTTEPRKERYGDFVKHTNNKMFFSLVCYEIVSDLYSPSQMNTKKKDGLTLSFTLSRVGKRKVSLGPGKRNERKVAEVVVSLPQLSSVWLRSSTLMYRII